VGIPMFTTIRAIMSPRRLRNSMILVAIIEPVGIGEPRRSRTASAGTVATLAVGSAGVLIPGPPADS